ncbi:hypothetical protein [Parasphingorhabdus sp.]|uniref:hypothetical protein n=1 Tax=Parasphingorhabdus sp. TaxID=2709688 RepID=UPI0030AC106F
MEISYGELEDFLAEIHGVAAEKRSALKGRLKHFQRLKWPAGTNQGKGARVKYGVGQTLSLATGFELLQLGLTPERVVEHFKFSFVTLPMGFLSSLGQYGPNPDPVFYIFSPESLQSLRDQEDTVDFQSYMISKSELEKNFNYLPIIQFRRFAFINIHSVLAEYIDYFSGRGLSAPEKLQEPLEKWLEIARKSMDDGVIRYLEAKQHGDT